MSRASRRRPHIPSRHLVIVTLAALAFALWRSFVGDPLTDAIEARLLDLRFKLRGVEAPPGSVVIVTVDEAAVDRLGWASPPRAAIAEAVETVLAAGPRVVALDLLFVDRSATDPADAVDLAPDDRVVLGAAVAGNSARGTSERLPELAPALRRSVVGVVIDAPRIDAPAPRLLAPHPDIIGAATVAHVNISRAPDRVARRVPLALWIGEEGFLPALSLEAARRLLGVARGEMALSPGNWLRLGAQQMRTDRTGAVVLSHYGPRGTIPTTGLLDVLDGRVPAAFFADRAVFIGATAESLSDLFATPFSADVPGVEILATLAANLVAGDRIQSGPAMAAAGTALAVLLAVGFFCAARIDSLAASILAGAVIWLAGAGTVQLGFASAGLWIDATTVLGALIFASAWCAAQRVGAERRLAAGIEVERRNLARYQSPFLAEHLARGARPAFDGRTQDAAVLFVDAVGYTTLVERAAPAATAAFLRELHQLYERCSAPHRGVIVSFEGDGALIVFGLPDPRPDDATSALDCGRKLLAGAVAFESAVFPGAPLALRVSVHFGLVTAAVLGGKGQAQITVTGDTVNVASRLQGAAKTHGVPFVASRAAIDAAGAEAATAFDLLADEPIRGRVQSVEIWAAR